MKDLPLCARLLPVPIAPPKGMPMAEFRRMLWVQHRSAWIGSLRTNALGLVATITIFMSLSLYPVPDRPIALTIGAGIATGVLCMVAGMGCARSFWNAVRPSLPEPLKTEPA
mgnify:CR=1 FL=1